MLEEIGRFISGLLVLIAIYFWFRMMIGGYQAAKHRTPGKPFWRMAAPTVAMFARDGYTEAADPAREKTVRGCLGFFLCILISAVVAWLTGAR